MPAKCATAAMTHRSAKRKSSTPSVPGRSADTGGADKNVKTTNTNLAQGKASDTVRTDTSYFDAVWNIFAEQTNGSGSMS